MTTDDDLARAIAGDTEAMSRVWHAHRRWVAAVLLARGAQPAELEDLLQDVALTLVERLRGLRQPAAFRAWLRTVAGNTLQNARDKRLRQRRLEPLDDHDAATAVAAAVQRGVAADQAERLRAVLSVLAAMQPEYREPMWLRTVQGLSQQQIADTLTLPVTTVETRLARARRMLRASLHEADAAVRRRPEIPRTT